eukprot:CAMPEP_0118936660 /NCGR_PEP_ID=MMETSP1169-20130426/19872_1 /TAXON_ID=36882 /ORGANISM="Pyramimonas obovata, Strain CCMP722" /LENGTH=37 /DNA_ID= /DNA_START= /DNA_END= /DNA_ORIENTATION=
MHLLCPVDEEQGLWLTVYLCRLAHPSDLTWVESLKLV